MSERIDHAAIARERLHTAAPWLSSAGRSDLGQVANILAAQGHATLALVEQQRIANIIDVALLQLTSPEDGQGNILGNGAALRALYPDGPVTPLSPDIAAALGIGDDDE